MALLHLLALAFALLLAELAALALGAADALEVAMSGVGGGLGTGTKGG